MALYSDRVSFTVPAGAGTYAPERMQFNSKSAAQLSGDIRRVTAIVEQLVATAVLELWVLKPGTDASNDANYLLHSVIANGAVLGGASVDLAVVGAQLRAKSGGTAGSLIVVGFASANATA